MTIKFSKDFGDGGGPETAENFVIFFGADALVDDVGGSRFGRDAVAHEGLRDKSKGAFFTAKFFPGVPVAITLKMRFKNILGTVFNYKSYSGTTNRIAEFKKRAFKMARF